MAPDFEMDSDFSALLEQSLNKKILTGIKQGDKVTGTVTKVTPTTIFVDISARDDAVIDGLEFQDENGELTIAVGDQVTAYCISTRHGITLTTRMNAKMNDDGLADAYAAGIPVEGKVIAERKGGYEVRLGNTSAFCPYSQMDILKQEASAYIGNTYSFLIQEYSENGRNVVVNHRKIAEKEAAAKVEQLRETLNEGDIVEGVVSRVMPFGIFVDIGGVEGLIHISELSWSRLESTEGVLKIGEQVTVKIKSINWQDQRIGLSLRSVQADPWTTEVYKYANGAKIKGVITRIAPFGLFVELEPGLEGLVHVSKLGLGRRVEDPSTEFNVGDEVEAFVEMVNAADRKISLTMNKKSAEKEVVVSTEESKPLDPSFLKKMSGENRFGSGDDIFGNIKL